MQPRDRGARLTKFDLERVYEIGHSYRAEPSATTRHITELTMLDIEMGFVNSHDEVMDMVGDMTQHALKTLYETFADVMLPVTPGSNFSNSRATIGSPPSPFCSTLRHTAFCTPCRLESTCGMAVPGSCKLLTPVFLLVGSA